MRYECFEPLEEKFALSILLVVKEYEPINKKNIASILDCRPGTVGERIDALRDADLIKIEALRHKQNMHMISLTERGKEIAELVSGVGNILAR